MPFGGMKSPEFGISIGLAGFAAVALLMIFAMRFGLMRSSPAVVLFGYFLFTLLTILLTAAGRADPADLDFTAAKAGRYLTVPLLNWAAFLLLCLWMSANLRWRILTTKRLAVAFSLLLLAAFYKLRSWREENSRAFADYQWAALSVGNGLADSQILTRIFPSPEFVVALLPDLKKCRLALFYRDTGKWMGQAYTGSEEFRRTAFVAKSRIRTPLNTALK
jgi:hypothetical protein